MTAPVAMVTGASRGIGAAIAARLANEGFALTVAARQEAGVTEAVESLRGSGADVLGVAANLAKADGIERLVQAHSERFGRLDLLVIGAGAGTDDPIADLQVKAIDLQLAVNLHGPILLVQQCLPLLRAAAATRPDHGARVVALASLTGVAAEPGHGVYGAAKAGLISFCEAVTTEESAHGVSATAISPGYVDTDMTAHLHERIDPTTMITTADVTEFVVALTRLSAACVVPNIVLSRAGARVWRA